MLYVGEQMAYIVDVLGWRSKHIRNSEEASGGGGFAVNINPKDTPETVSGQKIFSNRVLK